MENKNYQFETLAIRNKIEHSQFREHSDPIYLTSSFNTTELEILANFKKVLRKKIGNFILQQMLVQAYL